MNHATLPAGLFKFIGSSALAFFFLIRHASAEDLVIFGGEAFRPQIYLENEKAAGIIPALFERLSKDTGDHYQFVLLPWKRAIYESGKGHGGIVSFSWTQERAKTFDYSEPVYVDTVQLVVTKGNAFKFNSFDDLKGKVVGLPLGSSFGEAFEKAVQSKSFSIDGDYNQSSRIHKLLLGRVDVAIIGAAAFKLALKSDPELMAHKDQFIVLPTPLSHDPMYFAFPKTMHMGAALQRFNEALSALKKTREYQKIIDENTL